MFASREKMCQLIEQISHSDTRTEAMKVIIQYIYSALCIAKTAPASILNNAADQRDLKFPGQLTWRNGQLSFKEREASYIDSVNKIISGSLLGSEGNDAQFSVPLVDKKDVQGHRIGTITMENHRMRKIIDGSGQLIDISIVN